MFTSPVMFFSVYIPLVVLAVFGIIFEEKLIAFEQKIKRAFFKKSRRKSAAVRELPRAAASCAPNKNQNKKDYISQFALNP